MKIILKSLILSFLFFINIYATGETIIQVMQPNVTEEGIESSISTYIHCIGYPIGYSVGLTCLANNIQTENSTENRNIANIFNLKVKLIYNDYSTFGDTLKAALIIPDKITSPEKYNEYTVDEIISATIECMLYNAFAYDSIYYFDLRIVGDSKYLKLSKIYKRGKY
jgi:hypothetical protein